MTEQKAPREWIAHDGGPGFQAVGVILKGPEIEGHIVLVEHSAYQSLQSERDALRAEVERLKAVYDGLKISGKERGEFENEKQRAQEQVESANKLARENSIRAHNLESSNQILRRALEKITTGKDELGLPTASANIAREAFREASKLEGK